MPLKASPTRFPALRAQPRIASRGARPPRRSVVETCESRILFHLHVETPIPDQLVSPNSAPTNIDLYQFLFNEESGPTVRLDYGSLGQVDILLLEKQAPLSVANFLKYVNNGAFAGTVIHRSEPGFVIQGGGFKPDGTDISPPGTPTVLNEFSTARSNIRGTIAYAKIGPQGNNPPDATTINSATTEWFYNLADNSQNLDNQNGGFTAFGRVVGNGMAVADAIAALPRTDASGINGAFNHLPVTNTSLPQLPATSSPTPSDMVVLNSIGVISQPVTYTATSSDTSLVNPTVNGKGLTLTYGALRVGTATITVTATEPGGASIQDSFIVTVGATPVGLGQGANAQVVSFTDADGTVTSVSVHGGAGTLSFDGQNITQSTSGRSVTVSGTSLQLLNITLAGKNPSATIKTVGGDGKVALSGFTAAGPVGGVTGRGVVLKGNSVFSSVVGRLSVASVEGATITAPVVRNFQVANDFAGTLNVSGAGLPTGSPALASARIGGALASGTWTVGKASRVAAGTVGADWAGTFGDVASFAVLGDLAGDITANSINSLSAGSMTGSNVRLNLAAAARATGLNRLTSRGAITNSLIRSAANIGTVSAGSISGSSIYAGVTGTDGGVLPASTADFASASSIRGLTVRSRGADPAFVNNDVSASTLGRMSLGLVKLDNAGVPFGLGADTIVSLSAVGSDGTLIRRALMTDAAQSIDQGDFKVRVF